jgi:predicted CXXCH cytochrome family protein
MLPTHWPKWSLIIIAFGLIAIAIVAGLLLEPLAQAVAPAVTPEPTLPAINYARPLSGECVNCHTDREALAASAESPDNLDAYYIDPASLETPHGSLGCITCHAGTGNEADKDVAHVGLTLDLSETHPEDCLLCHRNLPDQFPEDHLRTPHGQIVDAVWEGSACGVLCSDCHGEVGHGFDPVTGDVICPMSVCLDCHIERNLDSHLQDCNTCHVGPHDVSLALTCRDCHIATDTWKETALGVHPVELTGYHATTDCFDCHNWPNFKGLDYVCSDCHSRPHEFGNDDCALCHTPDGWAESADALVAGASTFPHPAAGREDCRSCHGVVGQQPIPDDHKGRTNDTCQVCHTAAPAPAILHPVEGHSACLSCHGEGQIVEFSLAIHSGRGEDTCLTCHEPAGVSPLPVLHSMEGRADCLMCHASDAFEPFPDTHEGWTDDLCLLCHEVESTPTEAEHPFPQDHNAAAGNCALCHPAGDFDTYHCETCHALTGMSQVHETIGIREIEGKCVLCHPEGEKP